MAKLLGPNRTFLCVMWVTIVALSGAMRTAAAPPEWADRSLTVTDGLVVWLDAAAENAARRAASTVELQDGEPLAVWHDASGNGHDVRQPNAGNQPQLRIDGARAFVCFNGNSAYLAGDDYALSPAGVSVFIVAAPYDNDGEFQAFLALNRKGENDYASGLCIDQGPGATDKFETLNVEGAGFSGVVNLKKKIHQNLTVHRLCVTSQAGPSGTKLFVDGDRQGQRTRAESVVGLDHITVGGRFYGHGEPAHAQGFLAGEIAEVLVYQRVLNDAEHRAVDDYLKAKYADVSTVPPPQGAAGYKRLVRVNPPPAIQMFLPGFRARELPVDLPNVNNVLYRDDGALVAMCFNGDIYVLTDTDGDGLEDDAKLFWEGHKEVISPIGMDLTLAGDPRGRGVLFAAKGACLLVVDTDGDDVADRKLTVAEGWPSINHRVDALGAAFDPRDGSVVFGLGCQDYTNAYVIGADGKSDFKLDSERGTIMRVAPDFSRREVVATGLRFPVGIRFNRAGDLFCTDQEGATWLPNGNPFDELLCVERGRHYGFPPRHLRHLPNVVDEPSVFDYGPQHQSTCGLNFDEPVNGGPVFGPAAWQGSALVTGYSRGRLYRTALCNTPAGYVAQNHVIGTAAMLTADACVSPRGGLLVAAHSGGPDWGSGPSGKGKLFQVSYDGARLPQPVAAWAQSPHELWIAFDRELTPEDLRALTAAPPAIDYGPYVAAGDRFESNRPGYAVVVRQSRAGRFDLAVRGTQVTADRRNLIVATAPQTTAANYAVTLPSFARESATGDAASHLAQVSAIDLAYDLTGVDATWHPAAAGEHAAWRGWLPHFDLAVARAFTKGSAVHDELWQQLNEPGTLTLHAQLDLRDMLRPAVQPGAKLDFEYPPEHVTLICHAANPLVVQLDGESAEAEADPAGGYTLRLPVADSAAKPTHDLELRLAHNGGEATPKLNISYITNEDHRPRALPLRRLLRGFATLEKGAELAVDNRDLPELAGGNWVRGRRLFFSEEGMCSRCHTVRGEGGTIGPDLSNVVERDYASVLRDISEPSFAINPDFISQVVALDDGRILTGSVRSRGESLIVGGQDGKETVVPRADVVDMQASPLSIMPAGLAAKLGPEKMRDLLTFLLVAGPRMRDYGNEAPPPPPRTSAEVAAVLAGAPADAKAPRPIEICLVTGPKDHGPGAHDYPAFREAWSRLLSLSDDTRVTTADVWPSAEQFAAADVIVFNQRGEWDDERAKAIDAFLARGRGLVYIHYSVDGGRRAPAFARRIGLAWGAAARFRHGELDLNFAPGADHPIARNFDKLHLHDESYWNLAGDPSKLKLLASGVEDGAEQPLFWTLTPGKGRVFVSIPGHYAWTFDDPLFRVLLLRGIAWAADEPVDRFNDLVYAGARITSPAAGAAAATSDKP